MKNKIIPFPTGPEYFPDSGHKLSRGGKYMQVKHQHPTYSSEKEREERLKELKKICAYKLHGMKSVQRTA